MELGDSAVSGFEDWTPEDVARHNARVREGKLTIIARPFLASKTKAGNKYHAQKTERNGITFDSKAEARRYGELVLLKASGEILSFARQPSFIIAETPGRPIRYRPDFIVWGKDGACWVEDVKGHATKEFLIKQKLWESAYPHLPLKIIKG